MVKCIVPWTELQITSDYILFCCWSKLSIGHPGEFTDFDQIWNHPVARFIRHQMLLGQTENVCSSFCPYLDTQEKSFENYNLDGYTVKANAQNIYENIRLGRVDLDSRPLTVAACLDSQCNLGCIMCHTGNYKHPLSSKTVKLLENIYEGLDSFCVSGGEPFYSKRILRFLKEYLEKGYSFKISMLTNATCIDFKLLERLKLGTIEVSIDGATQTTYEKIRKGAHWEDVRSNVEKLIAFHRQKKKSFTLRIFYTVMSSNFHEVPQAVALYESMGIECIFRPVMLSKNHPENIFTNPRLFRRLRKIVKKAKEEAWSQATRLSLVNLEKVEGLFTTYDKTLREKSFTRSEYLDNAISAYLDLYKI